ncbi:MAG: ATP-dependent DNA helicase RecG [Clostridiales bacterium]|nr:ATP-dependent DNA helicase RecG [Clostridiales bacterium]
MRLKALSDRGIKTAEDLLSMLPKEYRDTTHPLSPGQLVPGEAACFEGFITGEPALHRVHGRQWVSAVVADECGRMRCLWFGQPWMKQQLTRDSYVLLCGLPVKKKNGVFVINPVREEKGVIAPVYRMIPGVPQKQLRDAICLLLNEYEEPDPLPAWLREEYGLMERGEALREAHFPVNADRLTAAKRRLAFEELLCFQAAVSGQEQRGSAVSVRIPEEAEAVFWASLPFAPTGAQRRVCGEIARDMEQERNMARLVQGDVGSGKTAVALYALYRAALSGGQGTLMAPTEILAGQHFESARRLLAPLGVRCGLLTGAMTAAERRRALDSIAAGEWQVVIGTHALVSENVCFSDLRLVVTDEQHRFGVRQRTRLQEKSAGAHVLVMSATPIPRTLSLILYGDLDISVLDEMPPGRTPVTTRIVPEEKREGLYRFIREEAEKGRRTYVVCPLLGEEEQEEPIEPVPSATQRKRELETALAPLSVGLVHGRMKKADKEAALEAFREGRMDVLVATTVVEVGLDVPEASIMVVEQADRFGLAQLHQLRGRVGRGGGESWCFLMGEPNERLQALRRTSDGFAIAEADLKLRGAGELFGTRQHGAPRMPALMLMTDTRLLEETRSAYGRWADDPGKKEEFAAFRTYALRRQPLGTEKAGIN